MSGRQAKIINEQAARYGLPFDGRAGDLPRLVRALHDFLAKNAHKLHAEDDPLLSGADSPALEEYRRWKAQAARMDVEERQKTHCPLDQVLQEQHELLDSLGEAIDRLAREYGNEAAELIRGPWIDACERQQRRMSGEHATDSGGSGSPEAGPAGPADNRSEAPAPNDAAVGGAGNLPADGTV
jgi:hypothetical protein